MLNHLCMPKRSQQNNKLYVVTNGKTKIVDKNVTQPHLLRYNAWRIGKYSELTVSSITIDKYTQKFFFKLILIAPHFNQDLTSSTWNKFFSFTLDIQ